MTLKYQRCEFSGSFPLKCFCKLPEFMNFCMKFLVFRKFCPSLKIKESTFFSGNFKAFQNILTILNHISEVCTYDELKIRQMCMIRFTGIYMCVCKFLRAPWRYCELKNFFKLAIQYVIIRFSAGVKACFLTL